MYQKPPPWTKRNLIEWQWAFYWCSKFQMYSKALQGKIFKVKCLKHLLNSYFSQLPLILGLSWILTAIFWYILNNLWVRSVFTSQKIKTALLSHLKNTNLRSHSNNSTEKKIQRKKYEQFIFKVQYPLK